MKYDRPVHSLMEDCARDLSGQVRIADVVEWFARHYPDVDSGTVQVHMNRRTEGASGAAHSHLTSMKPLFRRVGRGQYEVIGATDRDEGFPEPEPTRARQPTINGAPDILLVTCVKTKLSKPAAAKDLYTSPLFLQERAYAERMGVPWFILSAEHGLVRPEDWLSPYERYLPHTDPTYRTAWGSWVVARLALLTGDLRGKSVEIHASAAYVDAIAAHLAAAGALVTTPLEGLPQGRRLAWYAEQALDGASEIDLAPGIEVATHLITERNIFPAAELPKLPDDAGLYSWWVDETGAADLSSGLEIGIEPGLIYAGQAGATKWPSGTQSANTLRKRVGQMHLRGRATGSTFRLTLASILGRPLEMRSLDDPKLSEWMLAHLSVSWWSTEDRDSLGQLEESVLLCLDPPFNLDHMGSTDIRKALRGRRRQPFDEDAGLRLRKLSKRLRTEGEI